ncbi:MAG TPA: hypothetical protein VF711_03730 [Acidimicrobiales bacterium]|jgi:hypothetical protein
MEEIRNEIFDILSTENPATVRGTFYQLTSRGVIAKTESQYKSTVIRLLSDMRRDGTIPYGWIADNTRWMRRPRTYSSLSAMLDHTARTYRRALWDNQEAYVEVWLEKEALAGVLVDVTSEYDVPLMVTRGYSSLSFLHSAAEVIAAKGKPTWIYYFGDLDPSGLDIARAVESGIRGMAPAAEVYFERVAVTREQVEGWDLPTRPTKGTDSRSRNFAGESVEVDAIPASTLRDLVADCIQRHIDTDALRQIETAEQLERDTLARMIAGGAPWK